MFLYQFISWIFYSSSLISKIYRTDSTSIYCLSFIIWSTAFYAFLKSNTSSRFIIFYNKLILSILYTFLSKFILTKTSSVSKLFNYIISLIFYKILVYTTTILEKSLKSTYPSRLISKYSNRLSIYYRFSSISNIWIPFLNYSISNLLLK